MAIIVNLPDDVQTLVSSIKALQNSKNSENAIKLQEARDALRAASEAEEISKRLKTVISDLMLTATPDVEFNITGTEPELQPLIAEAQQFLIDNS